jgi:hypothetical protein
MDDVVGIVSRLRGGQLMNRGSIPDSEKYFFFSIRKHPDRLGPARPHIQWIPKTFSGDKVARA